MKKGGVATELTNAAAGPFYAVPANVGPRTMNYAALFNLGTYNASPNFKLFAGTTDDAFWIDLGAAFDTLNLRSTVAPGVLSPAQDAANQNFASDTVSGYAVNSIAIEVPISLLTRTGAIEPASSTAATIGVWATTSRPRTLVRRPPLPAASSGSFAQVQRMGNPLINELLVGTGFKDRFSMDKPQNDAQFAAFFLDPASGQDSQRCHRRRAHDSHASPDGPAAAGHLRAADRRTGYAGGPVADLLRLNTGVPPTSPGSLNRLGLLAGDPAGFPNGRRLPDDVVDIALRAVGGVLNPSFNIFPNNRLGDGVNVNDATIAPSFPTWRTRRAAGTGATSILANLDALRAAARHVRHSEGEQHEHHHASGLHRCGVGAVGSAGIGPAGLSRGTAGRGGADGRRDGPGAILTSYNQLALAYARRARETADNAYYDRAEEAIGRSLQLAPANFEAQKMRVWVLLGKHEFRQALELARALNKQTPDDLLVYGFLTDANIELGNYKDAEDACQWMLDLRPGNIPAFTRASYLRELFGDVEGAIELMTKAYDRTQPQEVEDRAWMLTQLGHLELVAGRTGNADRILQEALRLFPDYHYTLGTLARVRSAQKKHGEAADLMKRRYTAAPHPENLFALAEALERAGRRAEAGAAFAAFETQALKESQGWDNANRELVFYYANHARKPSEALRIANVEIARRQDVHTLDAHAWALQANNWHREAREQMDRALAVGIKDPELLARAAVIAKKSGGT